MHFESNLILKAIFTFLLCIVVMSQLKLRASSTLQGWTELLSVIVLPALCNQTIHELNFALKFRICSNSSFPIQTYHWQLEIAESSKMLAAICDKWFEFYLFFIGLISILSVPFIHILYFCAKFPGLFLFDLVLLFFTFPPPPPPLQLLICYFLRKLCLVFHYFSGILSLMTLWGKHNSIESG